MNRNRAQGTNEAGQLTSIAPRTGAAGQPHLLTVFEKPEDLLDLIRHERIRDLVAVVSLGQGRDGRPDWAIRAAQEFGRTAIDYPKTRRSKSEAYRIGFQWGVISRARPRGLECEAAMGALLDSGQLDKLFHAELQNAPTAEAAEVYAGFSDGLKRGPDISPTGGCVIYAVMAIMWPEVAKLKNINSVHEWLQSVLGPNMTGSRDRVAKLLQNIRFPLSDKGGRPSKKPKKHTLI